MTALINLFTTHNEVLIFALWRAIKQLLLLLSFSFCTSSWQRMACADNHDQICL